MSVWPACWYSPAPVGPPGRFSPARTLARRNFRSDPILRILILVLIFVILAGEMAPWRRAGARPPPWGCLVPWAPGGRARGLGARPAASEVAIVGFCPNSGFGQNKRIPTEGCCSRNRSNFQSAMARCGSGPVQLVSPGPRRAPLALRAVACSTHALGPHRDGFPAKITPGGVILLLSSVVTLPEICLCLHVPIDSNQPLRRC